jgi:hypothetical protein
VVVLEVAEEVFVAEVEVADMLLEALKVVELLVEAEAVKVEELLVVVVAPGTDKVVVTVSYTISPLYTYTDASHGFPTN